MSQATSYYQHHVFVCLNNRPNNEPCCHQAGAKALFDYAKNKVKALGLSGQGQIRINKAGCLDRCDAGPVMVVYPNETWYTFLDESDIDEIIQSHLIEGVVVERLRLPIC